MSSMIQTEYEFELPMGYVDSSGTQHRRGAMRLATATDEILPMKDPRVQSNPAYLTIILLARVVTKLGTLPMIDTNVIENIFSADFNYLHEMYDRINRKGSDKIAARCPKCSHSFELE